MKAKKAPERIYIHPTLDNLYGICERSCDNEIEYARKDAFIEKACKYWYKHNQDMVKRYGSKATLGCSEFTINVNDFKNYMKGE